MKTTHFYIPLILLLTSCSISNIVNNSLEKKQVYSDEINYEINLIKEDKSVKMIPLRHIGTPKFYDNLKNEISKYQKEGYQVYYELIKGNDAIDSNLRKFRKITALKTNLEKKEHTDYKRLLLEKVRKINPDFDFKKEIIPQPTYDYLIANKSNAKNVDVTHAEFVLEYERLFGEVALDSCDYINNWDVSTCETKRAKGIDKIIIDFRNANVVNTVIASTNKKIVIVYGENHLKGMKKELLKKGYKLN